MLLYDATGHVLKKEVIMLSDLEVYSNVYILIRAPGVEKGCNREII